MQCYFWPALLYAGAWVGTTTVKDGKGVMVDWTYKNGADYLPTDEEVTALRPAD